MNRRYPPRDLADVLNDAINLAIIGVWLWFWLGPTVLFFLIWANSGSPDGSLGWLALAFFWFLRPPGVLRRKRPAPPVRPPRPAGKEPWD